MIDRFLILSLSCSIVLQKLLKTGKQENNYDIKMIRTFQIPRRARNVRHQVSLERSPPMIIAVFYKQN